MLLLAADFSSSQSQQAELLEHLISVHVFVQQPPRVQMFITDVFIQ